MKKTTISNFHEKMFFYEENKYNYPSIKIRIKAPVTCIKTKKGLITDLYITGNKFNKFFCKQISF